MTTGDIIGYVGIFIMFGAISWFSISIMILQNKALKRNRP